MNPGTKVKIIGGDYEDLVGTTGTVVGGGYSDPVVIRVRSVYRSNYVDYNVSLNRHHLEVTE